MTCLSFTKMTWSTSEFLIGMEKGGKKHMCNGAECNTRLATVRLKIAAVLATLDRFAALKTTHEKYPGRAKWCPGSAFTILILIAACSRTQSKFVQLKTT